MATHQRTWLVLSDAIEVCNNGIVGFQQINKSTRGYFMSEDQAAAKFGGRRPRWPRPGRSAEDGRAGNFHVLCLFLFLVAQEFEQMYRFLLFILFVDKHVFGKTSISSMSLMFFCARLFPSVQRDWDSASVLLLWSPNENIVSWTFISGKTTWFDHGQAIEIRLLEKSCTSWYGIVP